MPPVWELKMGPSQIIKGAMPYQFLALNLARTLGSLIAGSLSALSCHSSLVDRVSPPRRKQSNRMRSRKPRAMQDLLRAASTS